MNPRRHVLVVGDVGDDDTGYVGLRLREQHHVVTTRVDRDRLDAWDDRERADLVLLLGSGRSGHADDSAAVVERESRYVRGALASGVPVLGICYGGQLLAHALGGSIGPSPAPEIGLFPLDSLDPVLCPPGPWAQMHSDAFVAPPTSRVLGTSAGGCQGFDDDAHGARALGWQFHPEVTPHEFGTWLDKLGPWARRHGVDDPDALRETMWAHEDDLRARSAVLVDAAVAHLWA
ncbi:MAG: gamma-glutamyl-gamma-aminobutyrate hydrolase family protein [Nocardioidaceae bacterium]|nr:gamma-glutamyl-gamma-aminobutyrate hydrolase family protein [Nocardioidaceae bacterium]